MAGTKPVLGSLTFDEGNGPPIGRGDLATLVANPAGGEPAVVLVKRRSQPFRVQLRGPFTTIPDVRVLVGTQVNYTKDGQTIAVTVLDASLDSAPGILDPLVSGVRYFCTCSFTLAPSDILGTETGGVYPGTPFNDLADRSGTLINDRSGSQIRVRS